VVVDDDDQFVENIQVIVVDLGCGIVILLLVGHATYEPKAEVIPLPLQTATVAGLVVVVGGGRVDVASARRGKVPAKSF
jgi:uncharacterized membrane protein (Fun14 family)